MENIVKSLMSDYGYIAIFLLIFIENLFPPIPSEVILIFGGFMTTFSAMRVGGVIAASVLGSLAGAIVLYYLGYRLGTHGIRKFFVGKIGRNLGLKPQDLTKTNNWFKHNGNSAVFFCRFIPLVRSLISIPAGISKMPLRPFLILTFLGSAIWNTVLSYLGRFAGNNWENYSHLISYYSKIIFIILMVLGLIYVSYKLIRRRASEGKAEKLYTLEDFDKEKDSLS